MVTKKQLGVSLFVVFLATSIYFLIPNQVRIIIENTRTIYNVWENDTFVLAATEYVNLWDGTTKMRASNRSIVYSNDSNFAYVRRYSTWKDNITTIQTYVFFRNETDVAKMPAENMFECFNCEGKIVEFEIRDIFYDGETKDITAPFHFGHKMTLDWQNGAYYAKVFQQKSSDKIIVRYKPMISHEVYSIHLFDPAPNLYIEGSTDDVYVEQGSNLNVTAYDDPTSSNIICINITCLGDNIACGTDMVSYSWNTSSQECRFNDSAQTKNIVTDTYLYTNIPNAAYITAASINVSGSDAYMQTLCYQETADIATSCGGLNTGAYLYTGHWTAEDAYDGMWITSTFCSNGYDDCYLYFNYSLPTDYVLNSSMLALRTGSKILDINATLENCSVASSNVQFRILDERVGDASITAYCMNSTGDWTSIYTRNDVYKLYEEAVWWNISAQRYPKNLNITANGTQIAYIPGSIKANNVLIDHFSTHVTSLTLPYSGISTLYLSLPNATITGASLNFTGETGSGVINKFSNGNTIWYEYENGTINVSIDQSSVISSATVYITAYPDFGWKNTSTADTLSTKGTWSGVANIDDNDLSTYGHCIGEVSCYAYLNYTAHNATEYGAVYYKTRVSNTNYTLPTECMIQSPIQTRITSAPLSTGNHLHCWNGTEWYLLYEYTATGTGESRIYETDLWRRYPNETYDMSITIDTGLDGNDDYTNTVFNYTSGPIAVDLNITAIQNYLDACDTDICDVPIGIEVQNVSVYTKLEQLNIVSTGNLSNPYIDSGDDTSNDWSYTGNFIGTNTTDLNITAIQNYLDTCTAYPCDVPIVFGTDNPGKFTFNAIEVNYTVNPVSLDTSILNELIDDTVGNNTNLSIYFDAEQWGNLTVNALNISYNGPQNYTVTSYYGATSNSSIVHVQHSNWTYDLPNNLMYVEFIPKTPTSKNVTPKGQTTTIPLLNITMSPHNTDNATLYINSEMANNITCVNMTVSNDYSKINGTLLPVELTYGTIHIPLYKGWNMISIPVEQENWSVNEVLSEIDGLYTEVRYYEASTATWSTYDVEYPEYSDFTIMDKDHGYIINMTANTTLNLTGSRPETLLFPIYQGWNLIGYPKLENEHINDTFIELYGNYTVVQTYVPNTDGTLYYYWYPDNATKSNLTQSVPGTGYWLNSTINTTLTLREWITLDKTAPGASQGLWFWSDYQCNYTSWTMWQPSWNFKACCEDCICD